MNRPAWSFGMIRIVAMIFLSSVVCGCGGGEEALKESEIPALPELADGTERLVVETIREHRKKLVETPSRANLFDYGRVLQAHRFNEMALSCYRKCFDKKEDFDALYLAARIQCRDQPSEAIEYLKRALKIRQDYAPAYLDLADALELEGEYDEALSMAEKALALDKAGLSYFTVGRLQLKKGNAEEAVGFLEESIKQYPRHVGALNLLVQAYGKSGKKNKALVLSRRLKDLPDVGSDMPMSNPIMRQVLMKARSYASMATKTKGAMRAGRFDIALKWANHRLEVDDQAAVNHAFRGEAHMGLKRYKEAAVDFQRAIMLDKKNPLTFMKLSQALVLTGRKREGFMAIAQARKMAPKDPDIQYFFAVFIWEKDPELALSELDSCLKLAPDAIDARLLKAKIHFTRLEAAEGRRQVAIVLQQKPGYQRAINLQREYQHLR